MKEEDQKMMKLICEFPYMSKFTVFDCVDIGRLELEQKILNDVGEEVAEKILVGGLRETYLFNELIKEKAS